MRKRRRVGDSWPIMPGSERPPKGWPGWPDGKKFAVILTHDIEGKTGLKKCRQLMELEMALGFCSSFNFIPKGDYAVPTAVREELEQSGFEVGVHDLEHDGRLFSSLSRFKKRATQINHYLRAWNAVGFRSGFMLHNLDWLHQLDIEYDLSTFDTDPFEPQPEGHHTIFPFWVPRPASPNNSSDHASLNSLSAGYVELPYTLPQDSTLFGLLGEKTADIWLQKVDWIAEHGGMVLLDTHPDYMNFGGATGMGGVYPIRLYAELLEYLRSKYRGQYWNVLPRDAAAYVSQVLPTGEGSGVKSGCSSPEVYQSPALPPAIDGRIDSFSPLRKKADSVQIKCGSSDSRERSRLSGKHAGVLLFSHFPADPRPRRAAEALIAEGVSVEVICLQNDKSESRHEMIGEIEVFRIPIKRHRGSKLKYLTHYSAFILRSFVHLALRSLSRKYDFVHIHNMPDVLVFSALVPKALGAKIVLDLHDPMPELLQTIFGLQASSFGVRLLKHLEKLSIHFADLVVTVNMACSRIFSSRSCGADKITVVMNSPDDKVFQFRKPSLNGSNGSDPAGEFSILYHGSLVPRNGLDLAVDALEIVKDRIPGAKLMVCGERNAFFEEVMKSVHDRGLEESVCYLGVKNLRQIVEAIHSCDLGVVPNHRNSFTQINTPTRIFEYLSLGKPVIAPRTLGIEDYFGKSDLLFFDAGDSADLARQIEFAYFNRSELARIVERGQQVYLANTWSRQRASLIHSISQLF
jgi:glycosyltransferase involved in cell wall biosynthesis